MNIIENKILDKRTIYSYGIVCFKLDNELNINYKTIQNKLNDKISEPITDEVMNLYKNKIKILLVQRKHSFSYVEFIRGKYDETNVDKLTELLNLMTKEELDKILQNNFDTIWCDLWKKTATHLKYKQEYILSNNKFNYVQEKYNINSLILYDKLYKTPEWGFPKGRKNKFESNIKCAIREFEEECGIIKHKYKLLDRIIPITETITCEDIYKLVYYFAMIKKEFNNEEININPENKHQDIEIGDIRYLTYDEVMPLIRPYFKEKIEVINNIFTMLINIITHL